MIAEPREGAEKIKELLVHARAYASRHGDDARLTLRARDVVAIFEHVLGMDALVDQIVDTDRLRRRFGD